MKSFLYNNRYKNLNYKQKIIADWRKGLLWVNACPGSGKTESIAINISNLVIENIKNNRSEDNSKILAFSFTNKAARELKDRVRKMISLEYPKDALSIMITNIIILKFYLTVNEQLICIQVKWFKSVKWSLIY